jgi:PTS system cellobiose-specific IIC component
MSISSDASKPSSADSNHRPTFFERRIVPPLRAFGDLPVVVAVRDALPRSFVALLAAVAVFVFIIPVPHAASPSAQLAVRWAGALLPSLAIMGAALLVILALRLAGALALPRVPYLLACVGAFALSLPQPFAGGAFAYLRAAGSTGLFLAIVVCLGLAAVFAGMRRLSPLGATALALAIAALLAALFVTGHPLANLLFVALSPLGALGDSYVALMLIVLIETLLWLIGVHGPALLAAVVTPVYITLQSQNGDAFAHHLLPPHIVVVSLFLFVFPGGAGATLPLAAWLAISRVPRLRTVGRAVFVPSFFNINEPLLFGLPIVFNGFLAVPFVLAPLVLATTTYCAVAWGWVARPVAYIPSAIPSFVSTYLATSFDARAIVLALANIAIAALIYLPFVRAYERHESA